MKKLSVAIAAALLSTQIAGVAHANDVISKAELTQINQYVKKHDTDGLRAYLTANPSLMSGTSRLAVELRTFYRAKPVKLFGLVTIKPQMSTVMKSSLAHELASANASIY